MENKSRSTVGTITLTVNEFAQEVENVYKSCKEKNRKFLNLACYGLPGIGKSETIKATAKRMGIAFMNIRLGQIFPSDFKGNPYNVQTDNGEFVQTYSVPSLLPCEYVHGRDGILLIDEFNMANPMVMGMAQELLDSRKIGSHTIPDGWMVLGAMNLKAHGCAVNEMTTSVNNRWLHYDITHDFDGWVEYALKSGIHPLIISFLKEFSHYFYVQPANSEKAYPTPRSWEYASDLLYSGRENISPAIGSSVASLFSNYYSLKDKLPDWDRIIEGDEDYKWVKDKNELSLNYAVIQIAASKANRDNIQTIIKWLDLNFNAEILQIFYKTVQPLIYANGQIADMEFCLNLANTKLKNGKTLSDLALEITKNINGVN